MPMVSSELGKNSPRRATYIPKPIKIAHTPIPTGTAKLLIRKDNECDKTHLSQDDAAESQ